MLISAYSKVIQEYICILSHILFLCGLSNDIEYSPGCSLEGLMLKLKLQYFGHLMRRADLLEKMLMLGKTEDKGRGGQQRMRWLDGITDSTGLEFEQTLR